MIVGGLLSASTPLFRSTIRVSPPPSLFRVSLPQRQSHLAPFRLLFPAQSSSGGGESNRGATTASSRFAISTVSVKPPFALTGGCQRCKGGAVEGEEEAEEEEMVPSQNRQLGWLRNNIVRLEQGKGSHTRGRLKMPEGSPQWPRYQIFSPRSCAYIYDPPSESKLAFVTPESYCHLCREPAEVPVRHCSWWDHVTRHAAIRLIAIYPRRWDPAAVQQEAQEILPPSVMGSPRPHPFLSFSASDAIEEDSSLLDMRSCYVFEKEAVVRRTALAAILRLFCTSDEGDDYYYYYGGGDRRSSGPLLRGSLLLSFSGSPAASIGERTFRAYISRQITVLFPPMAPESTTRLQQRCWGRKNLEMMFDLLGVVLLQKLVAAPTLAVTKNEKATIMRQIVYELVTVLAESDAWFPDAACIGTNTAAAGAAMRTRLLVELTLQRLAHELIHLQTMQLMEQTWGTYEKLGHPSEEVMEESSFC